MLCGAPLLVNIMSQPSDFAWCKQQVASERMTGVDLQCQGGLAELSLCRARFGLTDCLRMLFVRELMDCCQLPRRGLDHQAMW